MLDFSWSEILLIAVVTLMVVRPKDLPQALKYVAQFVRKARAMAREFQSGVEEMVREAELHEVKAEIESAVSTDLAADLEHSIDPGGSIAKSLEEEPDATASGSPPATPELPAPPPAESAVASEGEAPADAAPTPAAAAAAPEGADETAVTAPQPAAPLPAAPTPVEP